MTKDLKSKLSHVCSKYPVLFLPNHRSYMDFLLVSIICYHSGIPLPTIASGDNLKGLGFISKLLRNSGAFFIRRVFGSDKLYWALFDEYVQHQLVNRNNPLEFFIEGKTQAYLLFRFINKHINKHLEQLGLLSLFFKIMLMSF